ncbi:alpha/beta hydrolase [Celeribacter ethanolicus]|uniref:Alpha/beta hydrolase n=1 Tax=Celeribacter ethanolicus TaxID=1758178 RepID=A0A291GCS1_9RHOB|nr:alpha/beta hydrolase [Celeribacter ethanolicus]ATG47850.1 alpha/beta hydrolase [Celeribacter ethanolicus]
MSRRATALATILRLFEKPKLARIQSVPHQRRRFEFQSRLFRPTKGPVDRPEEIGGIACLRILPQTPARARLLYIHGGAYIMGSIRTHRALARYLSAQLQVEVVLPDYRLAPEHPFPAAFEDVLAVAEALPNDLPLLLMGDSAGGGLCLSLLSALCLADKPPHAAVALSPWTDLDLAGESLTANAETEAMLPASRIGEVRDWYLGGAAKDDPKASPLYADFPNCPPVLIQYSESEILADDARRMAMRLTEQGAEVALQGWPGMVHVWQLFHGMLPEADAALGRVADFVAAQLGRPDTTR